jgi:uncharacterized protein
MMVDYTGDIWPCHRFDGADQAAGANGQFRLGNIFDGAFRDELQKVFVDFDHLQTHKDTCPTCPANEVCGGYCPAANLADTGSIYSPHDTFCRWTWMMYASAERVYDILAAADKSVLERMLRDVSSADASGEK